jgi:hypothetical protein
MGKIKDFLRRTAGWKRDTLRRIDVAEELKPGRLVFADVGRHQPVQEYLYRMAWWDPVLSLQPTVELKFTTCTDTLATYGRRRTEGKLDHLPPEQVAMLRRDCDVVHEGGQSYSYDEASRAVPFEERFSRAITTCSKTIVDLEYVWGWDDAEMERLRPFNQIEAADYLVSALTAAAREIRAGNAKALTYIIEVLSGEFDREDIKSALLSLRDAGAAVLFIRRVDSPSPTYDLPADLHIIERYPLKNQYADEVVLITEERVVIEGLIYDRRRPEWLRNVSDSKVMPTVAEYNTGRLDAFPVKLDT